MVEAADPEIERGALAVTHAHGVAAGHRLADRRNGDAGGVRRLFEGGAAVGRDRAEDLIIVAPGQRGGQA